MICEEQEKEVNLSLVKVLCFFIFGLICSVLILLQMMDGNWNNWKQATCMPNDCFCETPRGNLFQQPANTWSNMGFVVAGLVIICQAAKNDIRKDLFSFYAVVYGIGDVLLGITSAFYHFSLTFVGQFLDNIGMFFVICWCITYNFARLSKFFRNGTFFVLYYGLILVAVYVNLFLPEVRRHAFGVAILIFLISQIIVDSIIKPWNQGGIDYFYFFAALASLVVAFGIWNVDLRRIYCEGYHPLQGHAAWHLLNALGTFYLYLFFKSEVKKPESRLVQ